MCVKRQRLTRRQTLMLGVMALLPLPRNRAVRGEGLRTVPVRTDLSVHPRSSWGAQLPPKFLMEPEPDVRFALVHHTAGSTEYGPDQVVDQIRQVYTYQTGPEKGWPDVCYHFFVDRFGGVWEGRAGSLEGPVAADATGGNQGFAQLVCLLGNFHEQPATVEMINSLELVLAWIADRYTLDTSPGATTTFVSRGSNKWPAGTEVIARTISGHREMSQTVCPGDYVYPLLESDVSASVHALRKAPKPANGDNSDRQTTSTSTSTTLAPPEATQAPPDTPLSPKPSTTTFVGAEEAVVPLTTTDPAEVSPSGGGRNPATWIAGAAVAGGAVVGIGAVIAERRRNDSTSKHGHDSEESTQDDASSDPI
jgi:hypothetical protein